MKMDLLDDLQAQKSVFKETPIWANALFGGPLASTYLIVENLKAFQLEQKIKQAWLIGIITLLFDVCCIVVHPTVALISIVVLPVIHLIIANRIVEHHFERLFIEYQKQKGEYRQAKDALMIALIGMVGTVILLLSIAFFRYGYVA